MVLFQKLEILSFFVLERNMSKQTVCELDRKLAILD